jgi:hypothetical protein
MRDEETSLYRYFDGDGRLLYVGASCNPTRRPWEHRCRSRWAERIAIQKSNGATRQKALQAEGRAAIKLLEHIIASKEGLSCVA